jgi:2,3-bisphosphoglycerate-dependent phosphoglycerate mutase
MATMVLLRHGRSEWNDQNLFTGWWDCDLNAQGLAEAAQAGVLLRDAGLAPTIVHTSLQKRAIGTANLALATADRSWIPVRRHWRLNERHYGDLTGLDKAATRAQFGDAQLLAWRRSYDTPPPPIRPDNPFNPNRLPQFAHIPPELLPLSECLKDVVARLLPYWYDALVPDLQAGHIVLVVAHGNSLRALVKHLDGISDDAITGLDIPTGVPLVYELDEAMRVTERRDPLSRALGDPEAVRAAADAVKNQAT